MKSKEGSYTLIVNQKQVFHYGGDCANCIGAQTFDGRVYTVKIQVTDIAGRIVETTCPQISVRDVYADVDSTPVDSLFRFPVQEFSFDPSRPLQSPSTWRKSPSKKQPAKFTH